jgi:hypothetical protein
MALVAIKPFNRRTLGRNILVTESFLISHSIVIW